MSYQKGDLKVTAPPCGHEDCNGDRECWHTGNVMRVPDARLSKGIRPHHGRAAYLPHSCDEWFIGGRAEVEQMIADLTAALEVLP